jgi:hypothetical protein
MNRVLSPWLFGVVDDSARAALMLALAGAAISLQERSRSQRHASEDTGQVVNRFGVLPDSRRRRECPPHAGRTGDDGA